MVRRFISFLFCAAATLAFCSLAGCAANKPKPPAPVPEGPVTSLELPEGVKLPTIPAAANEPDLVERVVFYRSMYARSLRALREYYRSQGNEAKRLWAEEELRQVWQIKPYRYILEAEAPPAPVKADASIAEADDLYSQGLILLEQATRGSSGFDKDLMKQSLAKFKELVQKYPTSDKVDKTCYYIGLIQDQYFPDDVQIALVWYQRAWETNPNLKMPARFNAARIYDVKLHDRVKALEMYRRVIKEETFNKANVDTATVRMAELTTEGQDTAKKAVEPPSKQ
jgi:tetratricopeptide (TPR) repeat protein